MPTTPAPSPEEGAPDPKNPRASASKRPSDAPRTPNRRVSGPGQTPKSAPAAAGTRKRANSKAEPPSLLTDFLLGRPSAARATADRQQRRRSVEPAKMEMRQASVSKLKQPGGVKDRVKQWQKTNARAMSRGDPQATPSEPTDVAFGGEEESVTEEDRVRIKFRRKKKSAPAVVVHDDAGPSLDDDNDDDAMPDDPRTNSPPKKRVISDDHWMNHKKKKSPPRVASPRVAKESSPAPIPKDFLQRTAQNPPVSRKIADWAKRVEIPDTPPERPRKESKARERTSESKVRSVESDRTEDEPPRDTTTRPSRSAPGRSKPEASRESPRTAPKKSPSPDYGVDDGIRIKPIRKRQLTDDGIRVRPMKSTAVLDDGIRVRPTDEEPAVEQGNRERRASKQESRTPTRAKRVPSPTVHTEITGQSSERIEVIEETETEVETPTKKRSSGSQFSRPTAPRTVVTATTERTNEDESWVSDPDDTSVADTFRDGSHLSSRTATRSLADIPVGYSAFSELDLPMGADAQNSRQRPKAQRNPSLRAVTKGLKKVVTESKKILHDTVDPPKPVVNKPPSIEKWLTNTVDPFVDAPTGEPSSAIPKRRSVEKEWQEDIKTRRRSSTEAKQRIVSPPAQQVDVTENEENEEPALDDRAKVEDGRTSKTPTSAGLKRSKATRNASSPLKSGGKHTRKVSGGKRPFIESLKDAFKGQSSEHVHPLNYYQPTEERRRSRHEDDDADYGLDDDRRRSSGSSKSSESEGTSRLSEADPATPTMSGPRRRPPTNGFHELSTIVSVESFSTGESDDASSVSQTTVTQSTALTKDSDLSRKKSNKSGLKRRLTKHSDLMSVLSLPDDKQVPAALRVARSRPSLRRARSKLDGASLLELLHEFAEDENLYQRELKTLVDGVLPVLLTQVVHADSGSTVNLFGPSSSANKDDQMGRAVVNMGIALEKMRKSHKRASTDDLEKLGTWIQNAVPIYSSYLDAWRLGFQDLIVNLAPPAERLDDEDSLLDAMPRNENGDVVNDDGERVDVAHLLKRPLIRIKMMAKFAKGVDAVLPSDTTRALVRDLEDLQEKARRRHKEESARMTDEEAANTDTTRARDLRTLAAMEAVRIDPSRGVNAKDVFSLDLAHSNGQRLECQIEMIHRDNPAVPGDQGDILIRQCGDGSRTWLLFPPVPMASASARRGDDPQEMVVMIRGTHNFKQWHELLILSTDNEEQILDWLDILSKLPVPPSEPEPSVVSGGSDVQSPRAAAVDVPVGASKLRKAPPEDAATPKTQARPSRYHPRGAGLPSTPPAYSSSPEKTPTQKTYDSRPLSESMRPDPAKLKKASPNSTPYREDGAPPPPIHRTLGSQTPKLKSSSKKSPGVKRRTSSPLKHEYLPSDISSESSSSMTEGSDSESSSDEIDSADIPDTELGISIKKQPLPASSGSLVSESTFSLTPSNSASQTGLHGHKRSGSEPGVIRYIASVSYWSDKKGVWKDLAIDPCSIVVGPGTIEAYSLSVASPGKRNSTEADDGHADSKPLPLLALDLTPLILLRQSTVLDLEIRSAVRENCQHRALAGGNFRFRCPARQECQDLYMAVHDARLKNERYMQLENETRFKHFGERRPTAAQDGASGSSGRRRGWFGTKGSYRASARAPSQSQSQEGGSTTPTSSSNPSASSFLKRLMGGNSSFDITNSSIDKQSRSGAASLYTSGSSSASGSGSPRSPSVSVGSGGAAGGGTGGEFIPIRLHLLVSATKWEDFGNCVLQIRRPPAGWHMDLRAYHGLEKRVTVTSIPKGSGKDGAGGEQPKVLLDAVLGSGCFTTMGNRGIVCGIWEEVRDEHGEVGVVPSRGGAGGSVRKWCFQCGSVRDAEGVLRLVHQEVVRA